MKILTIITLLTLLTACTGNVVKEVNPIKVGFVGPLSGPVAIIGLTNLEGIELAVSEINAHGGIKGRPIQLLVQDDEFEARQTLAVYEKFTKLDDVDAILSVSYSGVLALAPTVDREKVVLIDSLDTSEPLAAAGDYLFATGIYDEGIGQTVGEYAARTAETAAILYFDSDEFFPLAAQGFIDAFEANGGTVILKENFPAGEADFRSRLLKIGEAEAVVIFGYDESALALKQARELGIDVPIYAADTVLSEGYQRIAGEAMEDLYFTSWEKEVSEFTKAFVEFHGEEPTVPLFSVVGYDSMNVLAHAMSQGTARGEGLKNALYGIHDYPGVAGMLTMDPDGAIRSVRETMFQWRDGEMVAFN